MSAMRMDDETRGFLTTLAMREAYRDAYGLARDPILDDRLRWRAQTFRHLVHLAPGEHVLELGSGSGRFTAQLAKVSRGENPITSIELAKARDFELPQLPKESFDYVVAIDLLDERNSPWLLQQTFDLLKAGGQAVFYESNPWNPVLRLRRMFAQLTRHPDPRRLLDRTRLYELISEIGFIRVFAIHNDFVYAPLPRSLVWLFRNLSIVLENTPLLKNLAGSILIHVQKPPRFIERAKPSLAEHSQLWGKVSIVIPCYNEEMNVEPLVTDLISYYDQYIHEIILVDDNSKDRTRAEIERMSSIDHRVVGVFRSPPNGVGLALRAGYEHAKGEWVLSMDCDFRHLLPDLRELFDAVAAGSDVAVGSRFSRHSVLLNYPLGKILANRGFHLLARIVLRRGLRDLTNNLKLMRRSVLKSLDLQESGFAINAETGLQPLLAGFAVTEVPISWINRTPGMGTSSFRLFSVGGGYWRVLLRLLRNDLGRHNLAGPSCRRATHRPG